MSMVAAEAAAVIPVVFFDGDQSVNLGTVAVHPALGFKRFQAAIAQRIGVAPHQISASLVRPRRARAAAAELPGRRVLIDESSDLAAIARDAAESYVLAALRRPRRERRGRSRRGGGGGGDAAAAVVNGGGNKKTATAPEKTILRRSAAAGGSPMIVAASPERLGLELGFWGYESQLQNLQRQRESYLLSTAAAAAGYYPYGDAAAAETAEAACPECEAAEEEGREAEFHWCVRDAVTRVSRSPLGPIERPPKKRVEASA